MPLKAGLDGAPILCETKWMQVDPPAKNVLKFDPDWKPVLSRHKAERDQQGQELVPAGQHQRQGQDPDGAASDIQARRRPPSRLRRRLARTWRICGREGWLRRWPAWLNRSYPTKPTVVASTGGTGRQSARPRPAWRVGFGCSWSASGSAGGRAPNALVQLLGRDEEQQGRDSHLTGPSATRLAARASTWEGHRLHIDGPESSVERIPQLFRCALPVEQTGAVGRPGKPGRGFASWPRLADLRRCRRAGRAIVAPAGDQPSANVDPGELRR